jgi:hypothetical protein
MNYQIHVTRQAKQFMQVTVDASTRELAETFAVIKAQEAHEMDWEMESTSILTVEDIRTTA